MAGIHKSILQSSSSITKTIRPFVSLISSLYDSGLNFSLYFSSFLLAASEEATALPLAAEV